MEVNLPSKARGKETRYLAYLPGPEEESRPTVFLFHGEGEDYLVWRERHGKELFALAQKLRINLVMPDGDPFGWYLDSPWKKNSRLESYIMEELWNDLSGRLRMDLERVGALGLGMGGHGALTLALKHPGRFRAISSISGITDLEAHGLSDPFEKDLRLSEVLGPYFPESLPWRENSAYFLTRRSPGALAGSSVFLSVGSSDPVALAENRQYHRLLSDLSLGHRYMEERGGRSWELWQKLVPEHLALLSGKL
jgi:S-formylglutathione hydrolase FrmB